MVSETVKLNVLNVSISAATEKALKAAALQLKEFCEDPDAEPPPPGDVPWLRPPSHEKFAARLLEKWAVTPKCVASTEFDPPQDEEKRDTVISVRISTSAAAALEEYGRSRAEQEADPCRPSGAKRSVLADIKALSRPTAEGVAAVVLKAWSRNQATT